MIATFRAVCLMVLSTGLLSPAIFAQPTATSPKDLWPIEFSVEKLNFEQTIVEPGAAFIAHIPVRCGVAPWHGEVSFYLMDFWLKELEHRSVDLSLASGERRIVEVPLTARESGIFKVTAVLEHNGQTYRKDVSSFAAFEQLSSPLSSDSFFGHHVNSWADGPVAQAARLGLRWNRGHNMLQFSWWPRVQPEPGDFAWTADSQHERMNRFHMNVLGQFFGVPYWAAGPERHLAKQTGNAYPYSGPCDLDAFRNYVRQTVLHYSDVRYWEIWNEPDVGIFWNGTPEQFAGLCKAAYETAKQADPDIIVLNAGYTASGWRWVEAAAQAGALRSADAISFHGYYTPGTPPEQLEEHFNDQLAHWRELARKYAGRELPIWDTEGGSADATWLEESQPGEKHTALNWREAALAMVQSAAILQAGGVVRSFQYLWNGDTSGTREGPNALDMTNAPKPKLLARAVMAREVDGAKAGGVVHRPEGRLYACIYRRAREDTIALMWTGRGGEIAIDATGATWPGKLLRRVDIMGNSRPAEASLPVNEEPMYLHIAGDADAVIRALESAAIIVKKEPAPLPPKAAPGSEAPKVPSLPAYVAPAENSAAVFTVDLRRYANMGLADEKAGDGVGGWTDEGPFNDLREMATGRRVFHGVPFEILNPADNSGRSILTLRGTAITNGLPAKIADIQLPPGRVRNLYFLQAAGWGVPGEIGKYVIHYQDGQLLDVALAIPKNTGNWWTGYNQREESRPVPLRVTNAKDGKPAWRYLRVWEWQNPRRDVPITSIDFVSLCKQQTPILLAITGVR